MNTNDNKYISKDLSKSIFDIQEEERKRIARDLHDSSLQELIYISHKLELLNLYINDDVEKAKLELLLTRKELKSTINNMRNIIFDLRPSIIDDIGLKESLDVFFSWLKNETHFLFDIDIDIIESDNFILLNIYRIVVECVMNSVKYSEGNVIIVKIKNSSDAINIIIEDNGKGFDVDKKLKSKINHGISIIYERVRLLDGQVIYSSDIIKGTKIQISIPSSINISKDI